VRAGVVAEAAGAVPLDEEHRAAGASAATHPAHVVAEEEDAAARRGGDEGEKMGSLHVHEFVTLDGVIDAPTWTFDYEFLPGMQATVRAVTARCSGILLGRTTFELF
jgi:hypothetical protein